VKDSLKFAWVRLLLIVLGQKQEALKCHDLSAHGCLAKPSLSGKLLEHIVDFVT